MRIITNIYIFDVMVAFSVKTQIKIRYIVIF
jgi:hypothetical protein